MKLNLILDGDDVTLSGDPHESLFAVLKREADLFEDRICCQRGTCGRCLVLLDQREVPSCLVPFYQVRQREVVTPQGFRQTEEYRRFRSILEEDGLVVCRQCTEVQIFHLLAFLEQFPGATASEWKQAIGEIPCRCGSAPVLERGIARYVTQRESRSHVGHR